MLEEFHYLYHFYIRISSFILLVFNFLFFMHFFSFFLLSWNYAIAYNVSPWISERDNILQIKRKSVRGLTNCQCNTNPTLIKKRYLYHRLNTILIIIYYFDQNNQNPAKFIKKKNNKNRTDCQIYILAFTTKISIEETSIQKGKSTFPTEITRCHVAGYSWPDIRRPIYHRYFYNPGTCTWVDMFSWNIWLHFDTTDGETRGSAEIPETISSCVEAATNRRNWRHEWTNRDVQKEGTRSCFR